MLSHVVLYFWAKSWLYLNVFYFIIYYYNYYFSLISVPSPAQTACQAAETQTFQLWSSFCERETRLNTKKKEKRKPSSILDSMACGAAPQLYKKYECKWVSCTVKVVCEWLYVYKLMQSVFFVERVSIGGVKTPLKLELKRQSAVTSHPPPQKISSPVSPPALCIVVTVAPHAAWIVCMYHNI